MASTSVVPPSDAPVSAFSSLPSKSTHHTAPSRSFHEALAGSCDKASRFPELKPSSYRGMPAVIISREEIEELAAPFEFSLVGKFPLKRPSLTAIRQFFYNLELSAGFSVSVLDSRHVLIKLLNDLDFSRVFAHRSYYVFNCLMKLLKWSPKFDVKEESPIISIWISFPDLRPHLTTHRILHVLGLIFGKPLQIDQAIAAGTRPSVAKVLVELDITKQCPKNVWLGDDEYGYIQKIEFGDFLVFCSHCKMHWHSVIECYVAHPHIKKDKEKMLDAATNTSFDKDNPDALIPLVAPPSESPKPSIPCTSYVPPVPPFVPTGNLDLGKKAVDLGHGFLPNHTSTLVPTGKF